MYFAKMGPSPRSSRRESIPSLRQIAEVDFVQVRLSQISQGRLATGIVQQKVYVEMIAC